MKMQIIRMLKNQWKDTEKHIGTTAFLVLFFFFNKKQKTDRFFVFFAILVGQLFICTQSFLMSHFPPLTETNILLIPFLFC